MKSTVAHATFPRLHLELSEASYVKVLHYAKSLALSPVWLSLIPNISGLDVKVEQAGNYAESKITLYFCTSIAV